jgi:hypothetical protein
MAEVIHVFDNPVTLDSVPYIAQVVGRPAGHIWEGWIEFAAVDGSDVRRTPRETTQPDRDALIYWASGLSPTYLEGAIQRTLPRPAVPVPEPRFPLFDSPAPPRRAEVGDTDRAVLDPFSVGAKGEELLRRELGALAAWHLRNIVRGYDLADPSVDLERLSQAELIELIVGAVQPA